MAVVVVVKLELVDIDHHQRQRLLRAQAAAPLAGQTFVETAPVGDAGQPVLHAHSAQLFGALRDLAFQVLVHARIDQRDRGLRAEQLERLDVALGERAFKQVVLDIDDRDQPTLVQHRQHQHRLRPPRREIADLREAHIVGRMAQDQDAARQSHVLEQWLGQFGHGIALRFCETSANRVVLDHRAFTETPNRLDGQRVVIAQHDRTVLGTGIFEHDAEQLLQQRFELHFLRQQATRLQQRMQVQHRDRRRHATGSAARRRRAAPQFNCTEQDLRPLRLDLLALRARAPALVVEIRLADEVAGELALLLIVPEARVQFIRKRFAMRESRLRRSVDRACIQFHRGTCVIARARQLGRDQQGLVLEIRCAMPGPGLELVMQFLRFGDRRVELVGFDKSRFQQSERMEEHRFDQGRPVRQQRGDHRALRGVRSPLGGHVEQVGVADHREDMEREPDRIRFEIFVQQRADAHFRGVEGLRLQRLAAQCRDRLQHATAQHKLRRRLVTVLQERQALFGFEFDVVERRTHHEAVDRAQQCAVSGCQWIDAGAPHDDALLEIRQRLAQRFTPVLIERAEVLVNRQTEIWVVALIGEFARQPPHRMHRRIRTARSCHRSLVGHVRDAAQVALTVHERGLDHATRTEHVAQAAVDLVRRIRQAVVDLHLEQSLGISHLVLRQQRVLVLAGEQRFGLAELDHVMLQRLFFGLRKIATEQAQGATQYRE